MYRSLFQELGFCLLKFQLAQDFSQIKAGTTQNSACPWSGPGWPQGSLFRVFMVSGVSCSTGMTLTFLCPSQWQDHSQESQCPPCVPSFLPACLPMFPLPSQFFQWPCQCSQFSQCKYWTHSRSGSVTALTLSCHHGKPVRRPEVSQGGWGGMCGVPGESLGKLEVQEGFWERAWSVWGSQGSHGKGSQWSGEGSQGHPRVSWGPMGGPRESLGSWGSFGGPGGFKVGPKGSGGNSQ